MENKLRGRKGITLIALVITIIVLLILAGVSIATLTGENGVLTKTTKAKEATNKEEAKEQLGLILTDLQMDKYSKGEQLELNEELATIIAEYEEVSSAQFLNNKIKVTINGYEFYVNELINITDVTVGEIGEKLNIETINGACVKLTSANPEAFAKNEGNREVTKVAATGSLNEINISGSLNETNISGSLNEIDISGSLNEIDSGEISQELQEDELRITTPDGEVKILDLADETASVEFWAYKSGTFNFKLEDAKGKSEILKVDVNIPYTSEEYLDISGGTLQLKNESNYYIGDPMVPAGQEKHNGETYPISILNVKPNSASTMWSRSLHVNGITTIIIPQGVEQLVHGSWNGETPGNDIKTIYVPDSVTSIGEDFFRGLTKNTTIYFQDSAPKGTWSNNWNRYCSAKKLWNQ